MPSEKEVGGKGDPLFFIHSLPSMSGTLLQLSGQLFSQ